MRAVKKYSISELGRLTGMIESVFNKEECTLNRFIFQQKSVRYLNWSSLKKAIINKWDPGFGNPYLRLNPDRTKTALRLVYESIFKRVDFLTSADIIVIRANISLFYLSKGIRVKLFLPGGVRSLDDFTNEINIRKQIERTGLVNVPKILSSNLKNEPLFFADEIIYGNLLSSKHPKTPLVFKTVIPKIWRFYQKNGIDWITLKEKGIDINERIEAYRLSGCKDTRQKSDLDFNRIASFEDKLIPSSLIHGDLSIKNILVASDKNYVIDWETSRYDFIIYDFLLLLLNKELNLYADLERPMQQEIENKFGSDKNAALSLSEQIMLAHFLKKAESQIA